ncbi:hypothetical protein [Streptomyces sp. NPDC093094]|uniref:hypothetical protein n=1 Tax=Streptomyces sp. NPDC093094 TaxID=3366026 RepID=UPI00380CDEB6
MAPSNGQEYTAVLVGGNAWVGRQAPRGTAITWEYLSDNGNYPANACGITISDQGNDAYAKVVTTTGAVYQTHGDTVGTTFVWDEPWIQLATPSVPATVRANGFKGDLARGGDLNRMPGNPSRS